MNHQALCAILAAIVSLAALVTVIDAKRDQGKKETVDRIIDVIEQGMDAWTQSD